MTTPESIDWDQFDSLGSDLGAELKTVISVFLEEMDENVQKLSSAETAGDLAAMLHFLKGAALNLGLSGFAALCALGEKAARRGEAVDVNALRDAWVAARRAFQKGLAERGL